MEFVNENISPALSLFCSHLCNSFVNDNSLESTYLYIQFEKSLTNNYVLVACFCVVLF